MTRETRASITNDKEQGGKVGVDRERDRARGTHEFESMTPSLISNNCALPHKTSDTRRR